MCKKRFEVHFKPQLVLASPKRRFEINIKFGLMKVKTVEQVVVVEFLV